MWIEPIDMGSEWTDNLSLLLITARNKHWTSQGMLEGTKYNLIKYNLSRNRPVSVSIAETVWRILPQEGISLLVRKNVQVYSFIILTHYLFVVS